MAIGKRIKERREELGMTQQQLADRMGYKSKSTINKIESGANDVSQSGIKKFAAVLNTTIEYLMEMDSTVPNEGHIPAYHYDEEAAQIAQEIFDDKNLRALFQAARSSDAENIKMAATILERMKGTNPDG